MRARHLDGAQKQPRHTYASACVLLVLGISAAGSAQPALTATPHTEPVPADVAAPLKPLIATGGARVKTGEATLDFWWVKALPANAASKEPTWALVEEGSLIGVVRVDARHRDVRGRSIKPGTYTLRYGVQPENGDHLGVSRYRHFLLLSPAAVDSNAEPAGHDGVIDLSKQTIGISHPAVLSIDPPTTTQQVLSLVKHEEEPLEGIVFEVPIAHGGKPAGALRFGLILLGKIDA